MLVLTRKAGESFRIGDSIVVSIERVKTNGGVRVGIVAPPDVRIVRSELAQRSATDDATGESADLPIAEDWL